MRNLGASVRTRTPYTKILIPFAEHAIDWAKFPDDGHFEARHHLFAEMECLLGG